MLSIDDLAAIRGRHSPTQTAKDVDLLIEEIHRLRIALAQVKAHQELVTRGSMKEYSTTWQIAHLALQEGK